MTGIAAVPQEGEYIAYMLGILYADPERADSFEFIAKDGLEKHELAGTYLQVLAMYCKKGAEWLGMDLTHFVAAIMDAVEVLPEIYGEEEPHV